METLKNSLPWWIPFQTEIFSLKWTPVQTRLSVDFPLKVSSESIFYCFYLFLQTLTPGVLYTVDMFYMMSPISSMLNVKWFLGMFISLNLNFLLNDTFFSTLGIPFNDSVDWRLTIAEKSWGQLTWTSSRQRTSLFVQFFLPSSNHFHSYLIIIKIRTGRRQSTYQPQDYSNDVGNLIKAMEADPRISIKNMLICPSLSSIAWTPEQVWDTGFINTHIDHLSALAVEQ